MQDYIHCLQTNRTPKENLARYVQHLGPKSFKSYVESYTCRSENVILQISQLIFDLRTSYKLLIDNPHVHYHILYTDVKETPDYREFDYGSDYGAIWTFISLTI